MIEGEEEERMIEEKRKCIEKRKRYMYEIASICLSINHCMLLWIDKSTPRPERKTFTLPSGLTGYIKYKSMSLGAPRETVSDRLTCMHCVIQPPYPLLPPPGFMYYCSRGLG